LVSHKTAAKVGWMKGDPSGHYATLGVDPSASAGEIAAAYRRKARILHPDVPDTGDAAAFIRLRQAYDVLGDGDRRAVYDRIAIPAPGSRPPVADPVPRRSGWWFLPAALWAGFGGLVFVVGLTTAVQVNRPAPAPRPAAVHQTGVAATAGPAQPLVGVPASGPTSYYVRPGGGDAVLWQPDGDRTGYAPAGRIAAFSPIRPLRLDQRHGLVEIALADGGTGFVDAARLTAGDRADARRAYCAYNAGPPPRNGEVLGRHGGGTARVQVSNAGMQAAVVKLRDASGRSAATVFVAAGASAMVEDLPDAVYRPDFATGEIWSRGCNSFSAGMRAQRFAGYSSISGLATLVIPPDLSVAPAPEDIPDAAFERE
jgi:DnaJ domain